MLFHQLLQLVIEHQHNRRSNASPEIAQIALEETSHSLSGKDFVSTVHGALVETLVLRFTGFHHQTSSDGIERVGEGFGGGGDELSEEEALPNG